MMICACFLVGLTAAVHTLGIAFLLLKLKSWNAHAVARFWPIFGMLIGITWWLVLIHLVEISVWAVFYWWVECLPNIEDALYFSGVTYATIGYGDIVLERPWRILTAVEGLTGVLMCGLSAGVFFAVVNHIYRLYYQQAENLSRAAKD